MKLKWLDMPNRKRLDQDVLFIDMSDNYNGLVASLIVRDDFLNDGKTPRI